MGIPRGCNYAKSKLSAHILSLLAANLINISEMDFKHVKIINLFTCSEEFSYCVVKYDSSKQFKAVKVVYK